MALNVLTDNNLIIPTLEQEEATTIDTNDVSIKQEKVEEVNGEGLINPSDVGLTLQNDDNGTEENEETDLNTKTTMSDTLESSGQDYPYGLKKLFLPTMCLLCKVTVNSKLSAADHYDSKGHKSKMESWFLENAPQRTIAIDIEKQMEEATLYNLYCDICNIQLTSMIHAKQHYAGRKHNLLQKKKTNEINEAIFGTQPALANDSGFITSDENDALNKTPSPLSLETTCKETPEKSIYNPIKFVVKPIDIEEFRRQAEEELRIKARKLFCDICQLQLTSESEAKLHYGGRRHIAALGRFNHVNAMQQQQNNVAATAGINENEQFGIGAAYLPQSMATDSQIAALRSAFFCRICDKNLNSTVDFDMHCKGAKHQLKLHKNSTEPKLQEQELNLKYRLPSGSYYCDICNINFNGSTVLMAHLEGKRHIKQRTARASINN